MTNRASQIQALGSALAAIIPPAAPVSLQWAAKLYDEYNVRVELAEQADQPVDTAAGDADAVLARMKHDAMEILRTKDPELAAEIGAAQQNPEQAAELAARFRPNIPAELLAAADQLEALDDTTQ